MVSVTQYRGVLRYAMRDGIHTQASNKNEREEIIEELIDDLAD